MAKSENQSLKLLWIMNILESETDENNYITTNELIEKLHRLDIKAERKTIYSDINRLIDFGVDIGKSPKKSGGYCLLSRKFQLPEIKLLVDTVLCSKFITKQKSNQLIKKLESLVSKSSAKLLQNQVIITNRVKVNNEQIYICVDTIHEAIARNVQIEFKYFKLDVDNNENYSNSGNYYEVSPLVLTWCNENYYLIGYDHKALKVKHFRVDRMKAPNMTDKKRIDNPDIKNIDAVRYMKKTFNMLSGKQDSTIELEVSNKLASVIRERFGDDSILKINRTEDCFIARFEVSISNQFFGWIAGLGEDVKIISPQNVIDDYKNYLKSIVSKYE